MRIWSHSIANKVLSECKYALCYAVINKNIEIISLLISLDAKIGIYVDNKLISSALYYAVIERGNYV